MEILKNQKKPKKTKKNQCQFADFGVATGFFWFFLGEHPPILDSFCVPLLLNAVSLSSVVEQLKEEKISNQNTIIELQRVLIGREEEEIRMLGQQTSTSTDLPTSSSVSALNNNKDRENIARLQALWDYRDLYEAVAGGLKTGEKTGSRDKIAEIIAYMGDFTLNSSDHVTQVLKRAKSLREEDTEL